MMTTQERWARHVTAWAASGQSCKEYAAKAGINPRTLTWWKSKLKLAGESGPVAARFVEVTEQLAEPVADEAGGVIELDVGSTRLRVRGRVDAGALARVLDVLEGRR